MNRFPYFLIALSLASMPVAFAQTPAEAPARAAKPAAQAPQAPTADAVFAAWDKDKNQSLSLAEFREGTERMAQVAAVQRLKGNFDRVDRNHDGGLDAVEYATLPLVKQAGASTPSLAASDADKNGRVEFKEYVALVAAVSRSPAPKQ